MMTDQHNISDKDTVTEPDTSAQAFDKQTAIADDAMVVKLSKLVQSSHPGCSAAPRPPSFTASPYARMDPFHHPSFEKSCDISWARNSRTIRGCGRPSSDCGLGLPTLALYNTRLPVLQLWRTKRLQCYATLWVTGTINRTLVTRKS